MNPFRSCAESPNPIGWLGSALLLSLGGCWPDPVIGELKGLPVLTLRGEVTGLAGAPIVLQNNGGDDLSISADGPFAFATPVASGDWFEITVKRQPTGPARACVISNGIGRASQSSVVRVSVTCTTESHFIAGTTSGLIGSGLVLQNNGGDDLAVGWLGDFVFERKLARGQPFEVTVKNQPRAPAQTCRVKNSKGTMGDGNIRSIAVSCSTNAHSVGGTVEGLGKGPVGGGLVLRNNGDDLLAIATDGPFVFKTPVPSDGFYWVRVLTQPTVPGVRCTVAGGSGNVREANISSVRVRCGVPAPVITAFSPPEQAAGGLVTLFGADLSTARVTFGGGPWVPVTPRDDSSVSARVPAGSWSGSISVATAGGNAAFAGFTFVRAPTLTAFSPILQGPGGLVTLVGRDLSRATAVSFGGGPPATLTANTDGSISAIVPAGSANGSVWVTTPGGAASLAGFVYMLPPGGLAYSENPAIYSRGAAIVPNLPSSTGGPVAWYSVTPALPAGLSLNSATGVISGTPTELSTATPYTVTAANPVGSKTFTLTLTVANRPSITVGSAHACAVVNGGVQCWGSNGSGQLGNNSTTPSAVPVQVFGLTAGVRAVAAGSFHTCAAVNDGVQCWGHNWGTVPVPVAGLTGDVQAIAAGVSHSCALVSGGVKCWGENGSGQLGNNSTTDSLAPVQVVGLTNNVEAIAAGSGHTCAVVSGGLTCWGSNSFGQLGINSAGPPSLFPVQVFGLTSGVKTVAAGTWSTCAGVNGAALCWGYNGNEQLGIATNSWRQEVPGQVFGLTSGVQAIAAGEVHGCAVVDGGAVCWGGANHFGVLGRSLTMHSKMPIGVTQLASGVRAIATGSFATCAVANGSAWCWGGSSNPELLGNDSDNWSDVPVQVFGLSSGL